MFYRQFFLRKEEGCSELQSGRVDSALDSQPGGRESESCSDHLLDLFLGSAEFNSSATFVNSQLVCLPPVGVFNLYV